MHSCTEYIIEIVTTYFTGDNAHEVVNRIWLLNEFVLFNIDALLNCVFCTSDNKPVWIVFDLKCIKMYDHNIINTKNNTIHIIEPFWSLSSRVIVWDITINRDIDHQRNFCVWRRHFPLVRHSRMYIYAENENESAVYFWHNYTKLISISVTKESYSDIWRASWHVKLPAIQTVC